MWYYDYHYEGHCGKFFEGCSHTEGIIILFLKEKRE